MEVLGFENGFGSALRSDRGHRAFLSSGPLAYRALGTVRGPLVVIATYPWDAVANRLSNSLVTRLLGVGLRHCAPRRDRVVRRQVIERLELLDLRAAARISDGSIERESGPELKRPALGVIELSPHLFDTSDRAGNIALWCRAHVWLPWPFHFANRVPRFAPDPAHTLR